MSAEPAPIRLPPNRPTPRPYRGGAAIERFRRLPASGDEWAPEDFLASTVATFGSTDDGLTVVGGIALRDHIAADPLGYLGPAHTAAFGPDPRLLCKLLHTGERLFVHVHPDGGFARRELHAATGKTEAWIVLDVDETAEGAAWLGFRDDIDESTLEYWYDAQDGDAMLAAMNRLPLRRGDVLFVPAGAAHSIGAGVLILELQEPADLSVILEYAAFERLERHHSLLGLDKRTALQAVSRTAFGEEAIRACLGHLPGDGAAQLLPPQARPFFRAEWMSVPRGAQVRAAPQFSVIVVTEGSGDLGWDSGEMPVAAGDTILTPFASGETRLTGDLSLIRCMPPEPSLAPGASTA